MNEFHRTWPVAEISEVDGKPNIVMARVTVSPFFDEDDPAGVDRLTSKIKAALGFAPAEESTDE